MSLDKATVAHVARLARIRVEDKDLQPLAGELSQILDWIEQLGEVDTSDVAPMTSVIEHLLRLRDDAVTDGGYAERVLANAAARENGFFVVPKVVE